MPIYYEDDNQPVEGDDVIPVYRMEGTKHTGSACMGCNSREVVIGYIKLEALARMMASPKFANLVAVKFFNPARGHMPGRPCEFAGGCDIPSCPGPLCCDGPRAAGDNLGMGPTPRRQFWTDYQERLGKTI